MCLESAGFEHATMVSRHSLVSEMGVQSSQSPHSLYFRDDLSLSFDCFGVKTMYQALYRKYRPRSFSDVVGQGHITETLRNQVRSGKLSHAYLFIGTRGTGKTTCAKILAKAVNCLHPVDGDPCGQCSVCRGIDDGTIMDVVEMDAASNNGVDHVRALRDEAIFSPAGAKKRVYIIDEVHMLSTPAFNALLKIMEEPPAHLMFILATTELKKVPATVLSRCQRHSFKRIEPAVIARRLLDVAQQENLFMEEDAALLLGRMADGSMRDALSLMDRFLSPRMTAEGILEAAGMVGSVHPMSLLDCIVEKNTLKALTLFRNLWMDGVDPVMLLNTMSNLVRDVLLYMTAPDGCEKLLSGEFAVPDLQTFSRKAGPARYMTIINSFQSTLDKLKDSRSQQLPVELCLISLCDPILSDDVDGLRMRVEALEQKLAGGIPMAAPQQTPTAVPVTEELPPWEDPAPTDLPPWEDPKPEPKPRKRPTFEEMMSGTAKPVDDRPPWEDPVPGDDYERPPIPEEPPMTAAPPTAPKPAAKAKPGAGKGPDPRWEPFLRTAEKIIPPSLCGLLYQCSAVFTEDGMTLSAPPFPYGQLHAPANLDKLKQAAEQFYGKPVSFALESTTAGSPRPANRSLDELRAERFSNIVKFK